MISIYVHHCLCLSREGLSWVLPKYPFIRSRKAKASLKPTWQHLSQIESAEKGFIAREPSRQSCGNFLIDHHIYLEAVERGRHFLEHCLIFDYGNGKDSSFIRGTRMAWQPKKWSNIRKWRQAFTMNVHCPEKLSITQPNKYRFLSLVLT